MTANIYTFIIYKTDKSQLTIYFSLNMLAPAATSYALKTQHQKAGNGHEKLNFDRPSFYNLF